LHCGEQDEPVESAFARNGGIERKRLRWKGLDAMVREDAGRGTKGGSGGKLL
jgi:hypothetical protein